MTEKAKYKIKPRMTTAQREYSAAAVSGKQRRELQSDSVGSRWVNASGRAGLARARALAAAGRGRPAG